MITKQTMQFIGAKKFRGQVDGQTFDFTKLRALLPSQNENECGWNAVEITWGTSDNYAVVSKLKYPLQADVEIDLVMRGKKMQMEIVNFVAK